MYLTISWGKEEVFKNVRHKLQWRIWTFRILSRYWPTSSHFLWWNINWWGMKTFIDDFATPEIMIWVFLGITSWPLRRVVLFWLRLSWVLLRLCEVSWSWWGSTMLDDNWWDWMMVAQDGWGLVWLVTRLIEFIVVEERSYQLVNREGYGKIAILFTYKLNNCYLMQFD